MDETGETVIGALLYAASPKSYEAYNIVFTSERVIPVGFGWRSNSGMADIANLGVNLMTFPFTGPKVNTDPILMRRWFEIKEKNRGKPYVSYRQGEFDEILKIGMMGRTEHKIASIKYDKINKVTVIDSVLTGDYKVRIDAGLSAAPTFLIPTEALQEFKDLIAKTPIAQRLEMKAFTQA